MIELTSDKFSFFSFQWDTAGQERFRTITASYYRGADVVIIMFDLTSRETFDNVKIWYNECIRYAKEDIKLVLIGTKLDLATKKCATPVEIYDLCQNIKALKYFEISSFLKIEYFLLFNQ